MQENSGADCTNPQGPAKPTAETANIWKDVCPRCGKSKVRADLWCPQCAHEAFSTCPRCGKSKDQSSAICHRCLKVTVLPYVNTVLRDEKALLRDEKRDELLDFLSSCLPAPSTKLPANQQAQTAEAANMPLASPIPVSTPPKPSIIDLDTFDFSPLRAAAEAVLSTGKQLLPCEHDGRLRAPGGPLLRRIAQEWGHLKTLLNKAGILGPSYTVKGKQDDDRSLALQALRELADMDGKIYEQSFLDRAFYELLSLAVDLLRPWTNPQKQTTETADIGQFRAQGEILSGVKPKTKPPRKRRRQSEKKTAPLTVDLKCKTLTVNGCTHEVDSVQALRWIKVLAEHPAEWISGLDLEQYDGELVGCRPDRLKKYLPLEILSLVDSETGKGSRLRLLP